MKQKKCPEVAILMATYNGEKYLSEQLDSLLRQKIHGGGYSEVYSVSVLEKFGISSEESDTLAIEYSSKNEYVNHATTEELRKAVAESEHNPKETAEGSNIAMDYKIYIHDDGSNDNTVSIIRSYVEKYPDKITIIEGPPTGSAKNNFFYLMRKVSRIDETSRAGLLDQDSKEDQEKINVQSIDTPRYYFFCDQDDVWLEDKLQVELAALKEIEKGRDNQVIPSLVWCDMKVVDEQLNEIAQSFSYYSHLTPDELELERCIMHGKAAGCSLGCNVQLIEQCCELKETSDIIMHDWVLFLIAKITGKIKYIDRPLALYRQHGGNSLGAVNEGKLRMTIGIVSRLLTLKQLKVTQTNLKRYIAQVASLKQVKETYQVQQELIDGANKFTHMSRTDRVRFINQFRLYRHKNNKLWSSIAAFLI